MTSSTEILFDSSHALRDQEESKGNIFKSKGNIHKNRSLGGLGKSVNLPIKSKKQLFGPNLASEISIMKLENLDSQSDGVGHPTFMNENLGYSNKLMSLD